MSNKIVEAKTVQTGAIKQCNEALKEILTDANIEWSDKGLKIITLDPSNTILVHLKLEKENFEYFYCKHKIFVGINVLNLFKLLRTLTNNDALTLFIEEDNINQLGIRIENGEKNTKYFMQLENRNQKSKSIKCIITNDKTLVNQDEILKEEQTFYENLYAKNEIEENNYPL